MKTCPACGGPGRLLGDLGQLRWFRCRNCGIEFSSRLGRRAGKARPLLDTPRQTSTNTPSDQRPQTKNQEP